MKKASLILLALAVFALDWLAIDGITTGKEDGFMFEWILLAASIPLVFAIGYTIKKRL